ncbi:cardiolipin synthase [Clostridium sp. K12(2020)]|nr:MULTISPECIES: cardiolipin synthase [unclassified Clostridium]MBX9137900.1 cardiolipin synthase [Clostridium sp. K12(2020)]MBX9144673.1 cardiolipin synthase [Clostridium sp. K13]MDU2290275.1 cardiolipin synthase [Clostridium celatum]MDU4326576.1 cardiolipin synthase [Clostridium celatum]
MMFKFLAVLIHIINILTIVYMVFKEKRSANSIIAWTLILYIAPYIGFIAFLLIGRKINNSNMFGIKNVEIKIFEKYSKQVKKRSQLQVESNELKNIDMIMALEAMDYSPYRNDNEVHMYSDGKEFFEELLNSINKAKKSINIEFYIFKNDDIGTKILDVLEEKAKSGIEVRLLYDSVGSRLLNRNALKKLRAVGGKTGEFFPSWLKFINPNMNFRNHRKIVVIDNKVGFVGGFNVGDEYLGKDKKFGYWRDTHIKFKGSAVKDLNLRFLADWRYATKEEVDLSPVLDIDDEKSTDANIGMQIVSSGPNLSDRYEIKLAYLKMIQKAKKYIYIQSPYLIIDKSISDSLKLASTSGIDVRIMLPGKGDHPFVYWVNLVNAGDLLDFGVKIYHYDKNAFLHAKTVVIDDEICSIGTANMDTRSFELNFEVNAFIYSEIIAKEQKGEFEKDILKCEELTLEKYKNRSRGVKVKEAISRLFSDVL